MLKSWLLPILLATSAPQQPPRYVEAKPFAGTPPRDAALLQRTMIAMHDSARAEVRQPPLAWDPRLASDALAYAREMARTGRFAHAPQPRGNPPQGENLWTGTRGDYSYDEMGQHWIDEKRAFVNRPAPDFSRTGNYDDVTHYAQMIWARTTRFGCAMAGNATDDYLVCRYLPAGVVVGERALP